MWKVLPGKDSRRDRSEAEKGREGAQQRYVIEQLTPVAIGADLHWVIWELVWTYRLQLIQPEQ